MFQALPALKPFTRKEKKIIRVNLSAGILPIFLSPDFVLYFTLVSHWPFRLAPADNK